MPLFTEQDYEMFPEQYRDTIRKADHEWDAGKKTTAQVQDVITKIYSHPESKRVFEKLNKEHKLGLEIPTSPIDNYLKPLEDKIESIEKKDKEEYEAETKRLVFSKLSEYQIPQTQEKLNELETFRKTHHIENNREGYLETIELYAREREPEPSSAEYKPNTIFSFKEIPDESVAMQNTLAEIRALKKSTLGRR